MADRPIPFSAPMVRALLEGRKTQTRRVLKPQPSKPWGSACRDGNHFWTCDSLTGEVIEKWTLRYARGDRLWVKEDLICATEQMGGFATFADVVCYAEDGTTALQNFQMVEWPWKRDTLNARYCPRWASRLTLTVTEVRVQRLQDISEADAWAEGIEPYHGIDRDCCGWRDYSPNAKPGYWLSASASFCTLWNSLHGPDAWGANPWVAAYSFTVQHGNIDQIVGGPGDRPAVSDGYEGSHHLTRRQGQGIGRAVDSGKSGRGDNG